MSQDKSKDELEQRVEQLEETVQRMMPNRRQTLKGMGLLGGGALLGGVGSRQADASTGSAGNVGSDTDRPDIYGDSVDANSVSTNALASDIEDPVDVSGSRSLSTEYQNTDSTNRFVYVFFISDGTQTIDVQGNFGNTSGQLVTISREYVDADSQTIQHRTTLSLEVPPGSYYEIGSGGGNEAEVETWFEFNRA
jgi:hypothetical protein